MNTSKRNLTISICFAILLLGLVGCAANDEPPAGGASTSGAVQEQEAGSSEPLVIQVEQAGDPVGVDFRGVVITGTVRVQLTGAEGTVWQEEIIDLGPFAVNTVIEPQTAGEYHLAMAWDGPAQIQYALRWSLGEIEVPTISPLALMAGIGMVVVAVGSVVYAIATRQMDWKYAGFGAAGWVIAVVLEYLWATQTHPIVYGALSDALPEKALLPILYLYGGALTGVFEVAVVWLAMRYSRLGQETTWNRAFSFGVGFGAVEALLLGISSVASIIVAMNTPDIFPLEALEQIAQASNPLFGLAPIVERAFTVLIHISASVFVFFGIAKQQPRWFWLAFGYKAILDAAAAFGQIPGLDTLPTVWTVEALVIAWGLIGWWGTRWVRHGYPDSEAKD
jgi:uncharacterized membrane protein YhfC